MEEHDDELDAPPLRLSPASRLAEADVARVIADGLDKIAMALEDGLQDIACALRDAAASPPARG